MEKSHKFHFTNQKKIWKKRRNEGSIKVACMFWCRNMNKWQIGLFLVYVASYMSIQGFIVLG